LDSFKRISLKKFEDKLRFIYVGYIDSEDKGIDILLEAIDQILSQKEELKIFFEFCGEGPLVNEVKELVNKFPQYVKYDGFISYENIPKQLSKSDVFLFTSRREAFGRVIIEALASGLLIVCTKTVGSNEILREKNFAFFLEKLDANEIQEKILDIYNFWDNELIEFKKLQKMARAYAFRKYSYINELNGFLNLFNKVMKSNL
jgi:glycosyltransferase involved in cell wall biosynthesis